MVNDEITKCYNFPKINMKTTRATNLFRKCIFMVQILSNIYIYYILYYIFLLYHYSLRKYLMTNFRSHAEKFKKKTV